MVRREGAPEYSAETLARIAELQSQIGGRGGIHRVGVFHEQFCTDALRAGAKKCLCRPEIKILTGDETEERFQRAYRNHWSRDGNA
jgi:hypothetical protein